VTLNVLVAHTRLGCGAAVIQRQKRILYTFHSIGGRCPHEKPYLEGGVRPRPAKFATCCPIRVAPNDSIRRFFTTRRGIGEEYWDEYKKFFGSSHRYTDIPVMQASEHRNGDNSARA